MPCYSLLDTGECSCLLSFLLLYPPPLLHFFFFFLFLAFKVRWILRQLLEAVWGGRVQNLLSRGPRLLLQPLVDHGVSRIHFTSSFFSRTQIFSLPQSYLQEVHQRYGYPVCSASNPLCFCCPSRAWPTCVSALLPHVHSQLCVHQIWLTEFSCGDGHDNKPTPDHLAYMKQIVPMLDAAP